MGYKHIAWKVSYWDYDKDDDGFLNYQWVHSTEERDKLVTAIAYHPDRQLDGVEEVEVEDSESSYQGGLQ